MKKNKFFLALYAATTIVFIDFIGRLMLAEIIALINLPFINIRKLVKKYEGLKIVLSALAVLLVALILSDIINKSASSDFLRGWSVIIFAMISTIFFVHHLSRNPNSVIYYLFALFMVRMIFGEGELELSQWVQNTNYFKVRFVGFLNPAIMIIGYYLYKKDRTLLVNILFVLYGIVCMIMDARSNGLIFIISSFLLHLKTAKLKFTPARVFTFSLASIIILYASYVFYVDQVLNHNFGGNNARIQLSMASNPYNPFELIYYGRVDFIVLIQAVIDKPLIGHGSWGADVGGRYARIAASITGSNNYFGPEYISAHSVLLGTWVWAGIVGFITTLFMFYKLFKYFFYIYRSEIKNYLLPILVILFIDMVWAFFFSPIGTLRTSFPIFAALIIVEYDRHIKFSKNSLIK
jgi:hypothetical protein